MVENDKTEREGDQKMWKILNIKNSIDFYFSFMRNNQ